MRESKPGEKVTLVISLTENEINFELLTPEGGDTELAVMGYVAVQALRAMTGGETLKAEAFDVDGRPIALGDQTVN